MRCAPLNWQAMAPLLQSVRFDLYFSCDQARRRKLRELLPQCFELPEDVQPVPTQALVAWNNATWQAEKADSWAGLYRGTDYRAACSVYGIPIIANWEFDWQTTGPIPSEILEQLDQRPYACGMAITYHQRPARVIRIALDTLTIPNGPLNSSQICALSLAPYEALSDE